MAKFKFYHYELVQMWRKNEVEVEAETPEEAREIISKHIDSDIAADNGEIEEISLVETELQLDTEERVSKCQYGDSTLEVVDPGTCDTIAWN